MQLRLFISSLLPLLLPIFLTATMVAQDSDDPFGLTDRQKAQIAKNSRKAEAKTESDSPSIADEKVKEFEQQLETMRTAYVNLASQNEAFRKISEELQRQRNLDKLRDKDGNIKEEYEDTVNSLEETIKRLESSVAMLRERNQALKERVIELDNSNTELQQVANDAVENRNMMHQQLFETLLLSESKTQQESAIQHLFDCIDKQERPSLSTSGAKILRQICKLTESDSTSVQSLASRCLWRFHPESAIELGIQFGTRWKPKEYCKSSDVTKKIIRSLEESHDMIYDQEPLGDLIETLQTHFQFGVRLDAGIDANQLVTHESRNRILFHSLTDLLKTKGLGFAVVNDEILIAKIGSPSLIVDATYNVDGLESLAQVKTDELFRVLQESFAKEATFAKPGKHTISVRTSEPVQRKIQEKIASLTPAARR